MAESGLRLSLALDLFSANGALNYEIIASCLCAGRGLNVFLNCLCRRMTCRILSNGLARDLKTANRALNYLIVGCRSGAVAGLNVFLNGLCGSVTESGLEIIVRINDLVTYGTVGNLGIATGIGAISLLFILLDGGERMLKLCDLLGGLGDDLRAYRAVYGNFLGAGSLAGSLSGHLLRGCLGVGKLIDGLIGAGNFFSAGGALNYLNVAAGQLAGSGYLVLTNGSTGSANVSTGSNDRNGS